MRNKDLIAQERAGIVAKMNQAIRDNNTEAFSAAYVELVRQIEANVLEEARELMNEQDVAVLAQRGVRQLTSAEKTYYQKLIDAMKSDNPKQALNNLDVVMPETIINAVFEELTTEHPLLSRIDAITVSGLTRMMMNNNGENKATWGKLTGKIVEELTSGFKEVDVTQDKLSAFLPVSKAMLDLGPVWLDNYVRQVLAEAISNGLEDAIINGTGKDEPIGMMRQVGEDVVVTGGEYPEKSAIKVTAFDTEQLGKVTALIARDGSGKTRIVRDLIMVVNPVDYFARVLPATRMLTSDGMYVSTLPVDAEYIQSAYVPEGKVIYGMASKYFLGTGMSKNGKIEYSDDYRFLEDERVYLAKLYANGFAKDNNAFQVLDITDLQPVRFKVVNTTEAKTDDATLADLRLGAVKLSPVFAAGTTEYTAETSNATNVINAMPASATATIAIKVGDVAVSNGTAVKWENGENAVTITVTDGAATKTYTVTVTATLEG